MAQEPVLRAIVYACALRASHNVPGFLLLLRKLRGVAGFG
jgi:hypothetical protein